MVICSQYERRSCFRNSFISTQDLVNDAKIIENCTNWTPIKLTASPSESTTITFPQSMWYILTNCLLTCNIFGIGGKTSIWELNGGNCRNLRDRQFSSFGLKMTLFKLQSFLQIFSFSSQMVFFSPIPKMFRVNNPLVNVHHMLWGSSGRWLWWNCRQIDRHSICANFSSFSIFRQIMSEHEAVCQTSCPL